MIEFTDEENKFIDFCFETTLNHFVKNPKNRKDLNDIREVINYRNYNVGQIGRRRHELMWSIFEKMGYCRDGKTTKQEELQAKLQREREQLEAWEKEKKKLMSEIDLKIAELKKVKKKLQEHDLNFSETIKKKAEIAQKEFKKQIQQDRDESRSLLIAQSREVLEEMGYQELRVIAKTKGIPEFYKMKKAELITAIQGGSN